MKPPLTIETLPLVASDEALGEAVLGVERKGEFTALASSLEPLGLPRMNPLLGGRYVPGVLEFFERQFGLNKEIKDESTRVKMARTR